MNDNHLEQRSTYSRVQWLVVFRIAVVTFLLGLVAVVQFKLPDSLPPASINAIYTVIIITYIASILYVFLLKATRNIFISVYLQSTVDIVLATVLVYATGGIESVYSTLYPLIIIYSVLFLGKRGGLFIASMVSIVYGIFVDLEFYGTIHPIYHNMYQYNADAAHVLLRIGIHIVSFYVVALLASFVVEAEKKTKTLLSEKESAFDQLDILHKSIVESVGSGIITVDSADIIKSFNRAAEEITGISSGDAVNRTVDSIFPDFPPAKNRMKRMENILNLSSRRFEIVFSPGGDDKILGFSIYPLIDPEGDSIGDILIFQDLTSVKKMEREIEKNRQLAFMGEMSAVLAHELRSPIASISGSVKLLMDSLELNGSDRKLMEIVLMGNDQLENLVRDFLLFARPDPRNRCTIDIAVIIDEILESIRFFPDWNDNVEIMKNLCTQTEVYGNSTEIKQALWNIVLNAVQAMPDGGTLKIETGSEIDEHNCEFLEIRIGDTGYGIEKDHIKNVLEPFYTIKEKGTGLGLALVSRVVESHGGVFEITSEPRKGTQCTVLLPVDEPAGGIRV